MTEPKATAPAPTLRESPCPECAALPWHKLLIVPREGEIQVEVLSDRIFGYSTHYDAEERRTVYCAGPAACRYCERGWPPGWYGYLAVRQHPSRALRLLGIPGSAYAQCPRLKQLDGQLRGYALRLSRLLASAHGPIRVQVSTKASDPDALPNAWDVTADLARRFAYRDREALKAGQADQLPALMESIGRMPEEPEGRAGA